MGSIEDADPFGKPLSLNEHPLRWCVESVEKREVTDVCVKRGLQKEECLQTSQFML